MQLLHAFYRRVRQVTLSHVVGNVHQAYTSVTARLSGKLHVRQCVVVMVDAEVDHVQSVVGRFSVLLFSVDVRWDQCSQSTERYFRLLTLLDHFSYTVVSEGTLQAVLNTRLEFQRRDGAWEATDLDRYVRVEEHAFLLGSIELDKT
ncbi:hypothetical protein D3C72_1045020 [compost metagenome]